MQKNVKEEVLLLTSNSKEGMFFNYYSKIGAYYTLLLEKKFSDNDIVSQIKRDAHLIVENLPIEPINNYPDDPFAMLDLQK